MARKTKQEVEAEQVKLLQKRKDAADRKALSRAKKAESGEGRLNIKVEFKYNSVLNLLAKAGGITKSEVVKTLIAEADGVPLIGSIKWGVASQTTTDVDVNLTTEEIAYLSSGKMLSAGSILEHLINARLSPLEGEDVGETDVNKEAVTHEDVKDGRFWISTLDGEGCILTPLLNVTKVEGRPAYVQSWDKYIHRWNAIQNAVGGAPRRETEPDYGELQAAAYDPNPYVVGDWQQVDRILTTRAPLRATPDYQPPTSEALLNAADEVFPRLGGV